MNKVKTIFVQTIMISTAILFGIGIQSALEYLLSGGANVVLMWPWYVPLSIVLAGFLSALPTVLLMNWDKEISKGQATLRCVCHFFLVLGVVSLCGHLFRWYTSLESYMYIFIMYILIYGFVWISTIWMVKNDENKINRAISEIHDEE